MSRAEKVLKSFNEVDTEEKDRVVGLIQVDGEPLIDQLKDLLQDMESNAKWKDAQKVIASIRKVLNKARY